MNFNFSPIYCQLAQLGREVQNLSQYGITGYTGCSGAIGVAGHTGCTGPTGLQGIPGSATNTGATGPTGNTGPTGLQGIPGSATNTGATGPTGLFIISSYGTGSVVVVDPIDTFKIYQSNITTTAEQVNVSGNIIPTLTNTFTLGKTGSTWKEVYVGPGTINISGPTGYNTVGKIGTNLEGIVYTEFGFTTPFINVGPAIDPYSPVGTIGGWHIYSTGPTGNQIEDLVAQQINNNTGGFTGPVYSLIAGNRTGTTGPTGSRGPTGLQGIPGSDATNTGATGPTGSRGPTGGVSSLSSIIDATGSSGAPNQFLTSNFSGGSLLWKTMGYACFTNTNTITMTANIPVAISYDTTIISKGIAYTSGSHILFSQTGVYKIGSSCQFDNSDGGNIFFDLWYRKNNSDLSHSASRMTVPNNSPNFAYVEFIVSINAGDYIEIIVVSNNSNGVIKAFPSMTSPPDPYSRPNISPVIVTIQQIE
jgi:hypothetical protein